MSKTDSRHMILAVLLVLAGCGPSGEDQSTGNAGGDPALRVALAPVLALDSAVPGETFPVLWTFDMADGWHLYGPGRNDSGFPPAVKLTLPAGWTAGPLQWPAPERYLSAGDILDHVYHDQLLLLQEIAVPADAAIGREMVIPVRLDWLICKDECVPGHAELELRVAVAAESAFTDDAPLLAKVQAAIPVRVPTGSVEFDWEADRVTLMVPGAVKLAFLPDTDCGLLVNLITDGEAASDRLTLRFRAGNDGVIGPVKGILHQELPDGRTRNWIIDEPFGG